MSIAVLGIKFIMELNYSRDYKSVYMHPGNICFYFSGIVVHKHSCLFTHVWLMKSYRQFLFSSIPEWSYVVSDKAVIVFALKLRMLRTRMQRSVKQNHI